MESKTGDIVIQRWTKERLSAIFYRLALVHATATMQNILGL